MSQYIKIGLTLTPGIGLTLSNVQAMEAVFRTAFPAGRMMWGLNDVVAPSSEYADIRAFISQCVTEHGDVASYYVGFPVRDKTIETAMAEADTFIPIVRNNTGSLTPCVMSWFIPSGMLRHLRSQHGVETVWGHIWGQSGDVDGYSGTGSPNLPYYPSNANTLVSATSEDDRIDVLVQDTISQGLWEAQTPGHDGRITVHPQDAITLDNMKRITTEYLTQPNPIRWVDCMTEVDWVNDTNSGNVLIKDAQGNMVALQRWKDWVQWLAVTFPNAQAVTVPEFGDIWRAAHPVNDYAITHVGKNPADAAESVHWLYTPERRVALVKRADGIELADLTEYRPGIPEPAAPANNWSIPQIVDQTEPGRDRNPYLKTSYRAVEPLLNHPALTAYKR